MPSLGRMQSLMNREFDSGVKIVNDKDKFALQLDVHEYKPEEINVS